MGEWFGFIADGIWCRVEVSGLRGWGLGCSTAQLCYPLRDTARDSGNVHKGVATGVETWGDAEAPLIVIRGKVLGR